MDISRYVDFDPAELGVKEKVRGIVMKQLCQQYQGEALKAAIKDNIDVLIPKHIVVDDIFSSVNYLNCLAHGIGEPDDIDHLGNRRVRCVGELLQNQFRIGFSRMERVIRERMTLQDLDIVTPQSLINIRPVTAAIKEFFGSSPLSQFMDQTNPLAELTHKRRMSALGPGGLSRERASFDVRDVHYKPLRPPLPHRDSRRPQHRPYKLPGPPMPEPMSTASLWPPTGRWRRAPAASPTRWTT